ncbi:MAG TPA: NAD(P)-dependent oxidoreductase, partial [Coriobacteriia bacterium]|nr:NAD(P)-dependent oxidoreductase [Coriobacteriia bacterium]
MRVLLTGAAGFIGQHIGAAVAAAGHDVIGLDMLLPQAHGPAAELPPGVVRADVRVPAELDPLLVDVDVVCHQAAMVGNGVDAQDIPDYAAHNDYGTAILLAAMARAKVTN